MDEIKLKPFLLLWQNLKWQNMSICKIHYFLTFFDIWTAFIQMQKRSILNGFVSIFANGNILPFKVLPSIHEITSLLFTYIYIYILNFECLITEKIIEKPNFVSWPQKHLFWQEIRKLGTKYMIWASNFLNSDHISTFSSNSLSFPK